MKVITIFASIMFLTVLGAAASDAQQGTEPIGWTTYDISYPGFRPKYRFTDRATGEHLDARYDLSRSKGGMSFPGYGKEKAKTVVKFQNPFTKKRYRLEARGKVHAVGGVTLPKTGQAPVLRLYQDKKTFLGELVYDYHSRTVLTGSFNGQSIAIVKQGKRREQNPDLWRAKLLPFPLKGVFHIMIDGQLAGSIRQDFGDEFSLAIAQGVDEVMRDQVINAFMGYTVMGELFDYMM